MKTRIVLFSLVALACIFASLCAHAVTAVVSVETEPWFEVRKASGGFGALTPSRGYAPFPVFFEGWRSEPWGDDTEYAWDFGDGTDADPAERRGFNAAHVYERPGTYTATLAVTDGRGQSGSASVTVTVLEPTGKTYYVDAEGGNDVNDGLAPERAWRSADKALAQMCSGRYGPGDRVLFRRGQTFSLSSSVRPPRWNYRCGYSFGAYGDGEKPLIRRANGGSAGVMLDLQNTGVCFVGFQDLAFDGTSPDRTVKSSIVRVLGGAQGLLFLRCAFRGGYQHVGFNGPTEAGAERISGVFVVGCTGRDSGSISVYVKARRAAFVGNDWEGSAEQVVYAGWPDRGLFVGNRFARPSFGKTALRISAASNAFERPTEYVYVAGNRLEGWLDPYVRDGGNGQRWNYTLCTVAPNVPQPQLIRHVRWERNRVLGCETALQLGGCEDVLVRGNVFDLPSCGAGSARFKIGSEFETRPIRGLRFVDNVILSDEARSNGGSMGAVFGLLRYGGEGRHEGISLVGNRLELSNGTPAAYWFEGTNPAKWPAVFAADELVGAGVVRYGGTHNTPGVTQPVAGWHALTECAGPITRP